MIRKQIEGSPSEAVVTAVAEALDVDECSLSPLYETVDPDALNALLRPQRPDDSCVTFSWVGCTVKVGTDKVVVHRDQTAEMAEEINPSSDLTSQRELQERPPEDADSIDVLHIDDDPQFTDLVNDILEQIDPNVEVVTRDSVKAALLHLETEDVDCVLSDYDMPEMDGLEFLRQMRARGLERPFVLLTGKGSEEIASEAISVGASDYFQKSGSIDQFEILANRIRNLVQKSRSEQRVQDAYEAIDVVDEGIGLIDADGRFVYVNQRYAEILGYDREEMTGRRWTILYEDEEERTVLEQEVFPNVPNMCSDGVWTGQTVKWRKDGSRVRTDHRLAYTRDGMMVCLLSNPTDVSHDYDGPVAEQV